MAILVLSLRGFLVDPRLMTSLTAVQELEGMVVTIQDILLLLLVHDKDTLNILLLVHDKDTLEILHAVVGMCCYQVISLLPPRLIPCAHLHHLRPN